MLHKITKRQWSFIILIIFLILLYFILPVSIPLLLALITAIFLNPLIKIIQLRMKLTRKFSVIIIFLLFICCIGLLGTFIASKATTQLVIFVEQIPNYFKQINAVYLSWEKNFRHYAQNMAPEFIRQISNGIEDNLTQLSNTIKEKITLDHIAQFFAKIPQYFISFLVYLIALFLFMLELPLLKMKIYHLFTNETAKKVKFMINRLADVLLGFLKAQVLLSFIIFIVSLIGLLLISPQIAIVMALIIWVIDLIPIIGSIIILGPWAFYMFLAGDISMGIKLTILAIILLSIRRIMEPKLMGQHIGLSPLATLIAMFLGLKLIGVFGILIGPLLVIAFTSAKEAEIIKWNFKI